MMCVSTTRGWKRNMPTTSLEKPSLSILVPIFNVEKYLRQCLTSLMAQDYQDFEVILLNDGSTDSSASIAEEFARSYERVSLINKENSGYGATLNLGIDKARGTYLGFLESDDLMYPHALRALMDAACAHDADVVRGTYSYYWSMDNKDEIQHPYAADLIGRAKDYRADIRPFLTPYAIWDGVYRRQMLFDQNIRFLETAGASYQDTSFAFKTYAASQKTVFLDTPIIHYRQDNEGSSVRSRGKVYAVCQEYDEISHWLTHRNNQSFEKNFQMAALIGRYNAYLWNLDRIAPEFREEFICFMSKEFSLMDDAGRIDWAHLDEWRTRNLRKILDDPKGYLTIRERLHGQSTLSKVAFALELGGPAALVSAVKERKMR